MEINKVAVIGLGHFGASLCEKLSDEGIEVMAIDHDEDKVRAVERFVDHPVIMDSKNKSGLVGLGLHELDAVIVAIGEDFESSILTTAHLQDLGIKRIIARTMNPVQERVISLMGIVEQILPERESAYNLAYRLALGNCNSFKDVGDGYGFFEIEVPKKFIGKSLNDLKLREEYQVNLVTLKRVEENSNDFRTIGIPDINDPFRERDILMLFGKNKSVKKLMQS